MGGKKKKRQIVVAARVEGEVRTETLQGVDYRVVPAVLVKSQILHNNLGATYLPPEAFTEEWAEAVNMAPVILGDHPRKRGQHISARSPDVLNQRGGGLLFGATVGADGVLNADVYLDESRAEEVEELPAVLEALDAGEAVEISTGFPVIVEEVSGKVGNEAYDMKIYPAGFDHLAVFGADQIGACSVEDGCGLIANEEEGNRVKNRPAGIPLGLLRTLGALIGLVPKESDAENQSDEDKRSLLRSALGEKFGNMGEGLWIEAVFSDEGFVVFEVWGEGDDVGLWRTSFDMDDDGVVTLGEAEKVRKLTTFEPLPEEGAEAGNSDGDGETINTPAEGEVAAMKRQELIAQLQKAGMKECMLAKLDDEELLAIHEALPQETPGGEGEEKPEAGAAPAAEVKEPGEGEGDLATLRSTVTDLADGMKALQESMVGLVDVTKPAVEEQARERAGLVAELAGNERCPFDEGELGTKPMEELYKLQAMARGVSYAGQGGVRTAPETAANDGSEGFMEPVAYFAENTEDGQKKALDQAEVN